MKKVPDKKVDRFVVMGREGVKLAKGLKQRLAKSEKEKRILQSKYSALQVENNRLRKVVGSVR